MIPGESKAVTQILLNRMPLVAILLDGDPIFGSGELNRRAMLVRRTDRQSVIATRAAKASEHVGRKHGADEIAQMTDHDPDAAKLGCRDLPEEYGKHRPTVDRQHGPLHAGGRGRLRAERVQPVHEAGLKSVIGTLQFKPNCPKVLEANRSVL
jgi:hypothetical protein